MAQPTKQTKDERNLALLEKQKANEITHNLVLKIISWKSGPMAGARISEDNKISPKEWSAYKAHIMNISKTESVERVKERIQKTHDAIKSHNGFK